jgi:hypothetical protein
MSSRSRATRFNAMSLRPPKPPRFFTPTSAKGSFVVHFTQNPSADFGIWAKGYAEAANRLCMSLLSENHFGDNDAYPVVFLYRHSLELYLKGVIVRANHLLSLRDQDELCATLKADHRLPMLYTAARKLLEHSFPGETELTEFLDRLAGIVADLDAVDPGSFAFRYPVGPKGERPDEWRETLGLVQLGKTMSEVLEWFDSIDTALYCEADVLVEILAGLRG